MAALPANSRLTSSRISATSHRVGRSSNSVKAREATTPPSRLTITRPRAVRLLMPSENWLSNEATVMGTTIAVASRGSLRHRAIMTSRIAALAMAW
ncbi:hypothetical protein D9M68_906080 [compost metagenome]